MFFPNQTAEVLVKLGKLNAKTIVGVDVFLDDVHLAKRRLADFAIPFALFTDLSLLALLCILFFYRVFPLGMLLWGLPLIGLMCLAVNTLQFIDWRSLINLGCLRDFGAVRPAMVDDYRGVRIFLDTFASNWLKRWHRIIRLILSLGTAYLFYPKWHIEYGLLLSAMDFYQKDPAAFEKIIRRAKNKQELQQALGVR